jgi:hypothetical protein
MSIMKGAPFCKKIAKWIPRQPRNGGSLHSFSSVISKGQLLDRLLLVIMPAIECIFGMHIGFALGWLTSLCAGYSYVEHFEPVYLDDLNQMSFWTAAPNTFAWYGAIIGSTIGAIVIVIINTKLQNQKVK